jgi:hypothetical protein
MPITHRGIVGSKSLSAVFASTVAIVAAGSCQHANDVSGPNVITQTPTLTKTVTPTPTPTPLPLSGNWIGTFIANRLFCLQMDQGEATASLTESNSSVSGTLTAVGGACSFIARIDATRSGDSLSGMAFVGSDSGALSGSVVGSELRLVVADMPHVVGGRAFLRRP